MECRTVALMLMVLRFNADFITVTNIIMISIMYSISIYYYYYYYYFIITSSSSSSINNYLFYFIWFLMRRKLKG
jgi:hypothetical protein